MTRRNSKITRSAFNRKRRYRSLPALSLSLSWIISLESLLSTSSTTRQESKTAWTKSIGPFTMNNSFRSEYFLLYFSLYNFNFSISKFCSITMKVLFIDPKSFSFCFQNVSGWCFFFLLESRLLIQCSFILSFRDQKFPSIATKVINRNHFIILFCVFEVETLLYFYFCLFQVKIIYLLFRLFRLKLLIEFLNFICFYLLRPENFHYLVVILFILFYFLLFSILFPANF